MPAGLRVTLPLLATCLLAFGAGTAQAASTTIDFEGLAGPRVFCAPTMASLTIGEVTFSGGAILSSVLGLPADQTTVYGTKAGCPDNASAITITFATPVTDFSVQVLNGFQEAVSYTVTSNLGGSVTKTLADNLRSGADTFSLPDVGITSVTISPTVSTDFWNFFIDNVSFTPVAPPPPPPPALPSTAAECKDGGWDAFGVFKNQGDCVSYVATGGKNPPSRG